MGSMREIRVIEFASLARAPSDGVKVISPGLGQSQATRTGQVQEPQRL